MAVGKYPDTTGGGGGSVPDTRLINTNAGLTGGGDLSADRTIGVDPTAAVTVGSLVVEASGGTIARSSGTFVYTEVGAAAGSTAHRFNTSAKNAGTEVYQFQVNGSNALRLYGNFNSLFGGSVTATGNFVTNTGGGTLQQTASNSQITILGNRSAADTGADIVSNGSATRTAGDIHRFQNNGTTRTAIHFTGKIIFSGAAGAAVSGETTLVAGVSGAIATTAVKTASKILLSRKTISGTPCGTVLTYTIIDSTSFAIAATNDSNAVALNDEGVIAWMIID